MMNDFQEEIIKFYREKGREFPWRKKVSDLHGLIAGILLQKTPAERVKTVYQKISEDFIKPQNVQQNLDKIEKIIQPLGLYSRVKTIKDVAKYLSSNNEISREDLLKINGLGRYSVNMFFSTQYGKHFPVVDVNVRRVFKNYLKIEDKNSRSEFWWRKAEELLPKDNVKEYNLGLIDKGHQLRRKSKQKDEARNGGQN